MAYASMRFALRPAPQPASTPAPTRPHEVSASAPPSLTLPWFLRGNLRRWFVEKEAPGVNRQKIPRGVLQSLSYVRYAVFSTHVMMISVGRKPKAGVGTTRVNLRFNTEILDRLRKFTAGHAITVTDALERGAELLMKRGLPKERKQ